MKSRLFKLLAFIFVLAMLCTAFVLPSFASNGSSGTMADTTNPGDVMKVSANLTLHSNFDYNIIVAVKDGVKLKSVKVNGVEVKVSVTNEAEYQVDGHKTHVAKHHGIAPASANDSFEVEFTVVLSDKSELVATQTHSIAKYAEKILGGVDVNDEYSEAEQVIIDMLAYIEAAYSYEGKECPEITSARGGRNPSNRDKDKENTKTSLAGTGITSAQLYLGNQPSIRFYLKDTFDGEVKIKYTSLDGVERELTPDIETASDGRFFVQFSLRIYNMTRVFYVDVDGLVGTFDVYDYLSLLDDSDPAKQLVSSLIGYSSTSKEYKAPDKYTVRLDSDGGEYHSDKMIEKGKDFNLPPQANKYGHKFKGWYHGDEKIEEGFVPDGDVVITAKWESVLSEGLEYELSSDKSYYIVAGIGECTDSDVIIPLTYEGLPVREIGESSFRSCKTVESVTIPVTVKTIGSSAFSGCTSLVSVDIPEKLSIIGELAFEETESMKEVNVHKNNKHYKSKDGNLYNKDETKFIHYPAGKVEVEFIIPSSITEIDNFAFYGCKNLTSVIIPDSVTTIGNSAFENCTGLTDVVIPYSVTKIGAKAYAGCASLAYISLDENNSTYNLVDGNVYTKDGKTLVQYAPGKADKSFKIPECVESIGEYAFGYCANLTDITINDSITDIGAGAFSKCTGLTNVILPNGLVNLGDYAFSGCTSLDYNLYNDNYYLGSSTNPHLVLVKTWYELISSLKISASTKFIHSEAFRECGLDPTLGSSLDITIPDSVVSIGAEAFYHFQNVKSVTFGVNSKLSNIGKGAFCKSYITKINIPDKVKSISDNAFSTCYYLESVTFGENSQLESIGACAFYDSGITSISIPEKVISIGDDAFCLCVFLESVTFGENSQLSSIGTSAFYSAFITSIDIPDGVTYIGKSAFESSNLVSVVIPEGVKSIEDYTFSGCSNLVSVVIPDSMTKIGEYAFSGCDSLTDVYYRGYRSKWLSITKGTDNEYLINATLHCGYGVEDYVGELEYVSNGDGTCYVSGNGDFTGRELVIPSTFAGMTVIGIADEAFYDGDYTSVVIPDSVTSIGSYAFWCCPFESVSFGEGSMLKSIGDSAFYCTFITSIDIPDGVTYIGESAFESSYLVSVVIPEGVTFIEKYAFSYCMELESITIPIGVVEIGDYAFSECESLTDVYYGGSEEDWAKITIEDGNEYLTNATIHFSSVPEDEEKPVYKDEYDFLNDTPMIWNEEFAAD